MTVRAVNLIGYPCGMGAANHDCAAGPQSLRSAGLDLFLEEVGVDARWSPIIDSCDDSKDAVTNVQASCQTLYNQVTEALRAQEFPLTIGGDHSMAIGTWSAATVVLEAQEQFGLLWIDAHMDAHTSESSPSGNIHGMPLACLLNRGDSPLNHLGHEGAKLNPSHVCLVGIRSFEPKEAERLQRLGVRIFDMGYIRKHGLDAVMKEALEVVSRGTKGFGLTFDLDALDPAIAPGTGTRETNGLLKEETLHALRGIAHHTKMTAIEIAEYNPALDVDGLTEALIVELISTMFDR